MGLEPVNCQLKNELIEATKKEYPNYPNMDNYLLWLCAVDYVLEEKGLKKDNDEDFKMYEEYIKEKKLFVYNNVRVVREDPVMTQMTGLGSHAVP